MTSALTILKLARCRIADGGWIKGALCRVGPDRRTCYCLEGALYYSGWKSMFSPNVVIRRTRHALWYWNDRVAQSRDDVVHLLDSCIKEIQDE
jgi:hypothetical protein